MKHAATSPSKARAAVQRGILFSALRLSWCARLDFNYRLLSGHQRSFHRRRDLPHVGFARQARFDHAHHFAHIAGACMGDGDFLHDDTVFVTHAAERCESRQVFKKVLKNGATGVFQGKILVKQGAQKTDGYQISQSLLLDDDSQFLAKPELEIYADDVKCSHGSTSGAIDDTALYYLRSRGVPLRQAQSLLVLAFLAEAIAEIADEAIAEDIRGRLESWLHRHEH